MISVRFYIHQRLEKVILGKQHSQGRSPISPQAECLGLEIIFNIMFGVKYKKLKKKINQLRQIDTDISETKSTFSILKLIGLNMFFINDTEFFVWKYTIITHTSFTITMLVICLDIQTNTKAYIFRCHMQAKVDIELAKILV